MRRRDSAAEPRHFRRRFIGRLFVVHIGASVHVRVDNAKQHVFQHLCDEAKEKRKKKKEKRKIKIVLNHKMSIFNQ